MSDGAIAVCGGPACCCTISVFCYLMVSIMAWPVHSLNQDESLAAKANEPTQPRRNSQQHAPNHLCPKQVGLARHPLYHRLALILKSPSNLEKLHENRAVHAFARARQQHQKNHDSCALRRVGSSASGGSGRLVRSPIPRVFYVHEQLWIQCFGERRACRCRSMVSALIHAQKEGEKP